jgi:hypothetical protein
MVAFLSDPQGSKSTKRFFSSFTIESGVSLSWARRSRASRGLSNRFYAHTGLSLTPRLVVTL